MNVKVGRIKILHKEIDLCEEASVQACCPYYPLIELFLSRRNANVSVQCPVKKGVYHVTQTVTLPKEIPPGTYSTNPDLECQIDSKEDCLPIIRSYMYMRKHRLYTSFEKIWSRQKL